MRDYNSYCSDFQEVGFEKKGGLKINNPTVLPVSTRLSLYKKSY